MEDHPQPLVVREASIGGRVCNERPDLSMSRSSRAAPTPARVDSPRLGGGLAYAAGCAVLAGGYAAVFVAAGASARFAVIAAAAVVLPNALLGWVSLHLARRWPWPDQGGAGIARAALAELLRFGMSVEQRKVDRVALRDEWAFVTSYLELERLRLGDRLRLELRADPAALDLPIPPFAVQPLVENAIVHGVASRGAGGEVRVSVRREGRRLHIEVTDDGPGALEPAILASP